MKSFSKKIVFWTGLLFASQIVMANAASLLYKDTSIYVYTIPSTAAIFGASIIFYLNKAKMENLLKIKIAFTKFKLAISKLISPEAMAEVENEFMSLEQAVDMKIDNTISEAMNEDVTLMNC